MVTSREQAAKAQREARDWWDKLGQKSITTAEVIAFATWRDDPTNDAAYSKIEAEAPRDRGRYVVLPSPGGFGVIDTFTGEPATFAKVRQTGIDVQDANEIADILNLRHQSRHDAN